MDLSKITTYQSGVVQAAAFRNLNKHFADLLKEHNLTCMQWFVIGTIHDAGKEGIRISDLAATLQTGLPYITNTVNLLESKNMVEKRDNDSDNRIKCVTITPHFSKECEQIEKNLRSKLRKSLYQNITPEELRTYVKVLYELSRIG